MSIKYPDPLRIRGFTTIPVVLFALLLLAACGSQVTPTVPPSASPVPSLPSPTATAVQPTAVPHYSGGSIVVAGIGQPSREVTALPRFVSDALYDSLVHVNPADGSLVPGMADTWQVSNDARTIAFHLRSGLKWSDGKPLTADDVVYTFKTLSDASLRLTPGGDFTALTDVSAGDLQTVTVKLEQSYCAALTNLGMVKILPAHVLKGKDLGNLSDAEFVGSGPLVLKSWTREALTFGRNPNYWGGQPWIENWTYRVFANEGDAQAALGGGQADLLASELAPGAADPPPAGVNRTVYPANRFYALAINSDNGVSDASVRQAVAASIDRGSIASSLFGAQAPVLTASVLPSFWAAPSSATGPTYDPARAKQLLASAGWSDSNGDGVLDKGGKPLRITLWAVADDPVQEPIAMAIRAMLAQIGVQVIVQLDDRAGFLTRVFQHEYDLAVLDWDIPLDPDQHWYWQSGENKKGSGFNVTSYASQAADDLLSRGLSVPGCDAAGRKVIYAQLYKTVAADSPEVFILAPPAQVDARANLRGVAPSSFGGPYWNLAQWEVSP